MKRILVTGSNGFLGQKITQRCLSGGDFKLIATGKGANRFPRTGGYTYEELDVRDGIKVNKLLERLRPDVLINTAAMALPDQCEEDRIACEELNVTAVAYLAAVCKILGIHFIHLSSDFVFDGVAGPYSESDLPNPLSRYGESKLAGEEAVIRSGATWTILRTVLVYGVMPGSGRSNLVLWAKSALEKQTPIRVVADQFRTPTLAEDLADACIAAALRSTGGLFHVSGRDLMNVYAVACRVADFWQLDATLISPVLTADLREKARRPLKSGFYIDKAEKELGFRPHTLDEGFALIDRQMKENF